jgi:hypothetical protein
MMISAELKSVIGQNCPGYDARYGITIMNSGVFSESCNNCSNYVRGKCIKDLLDEMRNKVCRN